MPVQKTMEAFCCIELKWLIVVVGEVQARYKSVPFLFTSGYALGGFRAPAPHKTAIHRFSILSILE
jgi:hypothetical protein